MKIFLACAVLMAAASAFGANPDYNAFRGTGGITVVSNPPNGTIVIDGSTISGSAVPGGSTYSVQWNTNGSFAGDGHFQYTPELGGGDPSARLRLSYNTATNIFSAIGVGSESAHEFYLMSGGLTRWGVGTSGDLNTFSDVAAYNIGTIGLNRRPFYVNAQSSFALDDRNVLTKSGNELSVGNNGTWTDLHLYANGASRIRITSSGNVGIGTQVPTAHLTVSNETITGAIVALYASNNPTPVILANSNGFVGINRGTPLARLHLSATNQPIGGSYASYGNFYVGSSDALGANLGGSIGLGGNQNTGDAQGTFAKIHGKKSFATAGDTSGHLVFETANAAAAMVERVRIDSVGNVSIAAGHLTFGIHNTYDIGASGASSPRNVYVGSSLTAANVAVNTLLTLPSVTVNSLLYVDGGNEVDNATLGGGHTLSSGLLSHTNLVLANTTNQIVFGATNIAPSSIVAPTKWISVQISGEAATYRLPLYQ